MGPGYFIIAIMGCGDGSAACTPVMTVPTHYATEEACVAATPAALLENSDFDFPSLLAQCRPGQAPASAEREPEAPDPGQLRRG